MSAAGATALVVAYQQQARSIRAEVEAFILALWASLGTYREPQMRDFIGQATPFVLGAQQHMAALTAAYLAEHLYEVTGTRAALPALPTSQVTGPAVRNGTSVAEVYGRPFHLVWRRLAAAAADRDAANQWTQPTPEYPTRPAGPRVDFVERAIKAGADRAVNLAHTDIQLTKTRSAQRLLPATRAVGYRRVLEGVDSCALCIVAATLIYHKGKLMPVHPGCDCSTEPVYRSASATTAPHARVNDELIPVDELQTVHDAIAARFGQSSPGAQQIPGQGALRYRDVLIEHQDGELGPVLAIRGQKFTGPADLAA